MYYIGYILFVINDKEILHYNNQNSPIQNGSALKAESNHN